MIKNKVKIIKLGRLAQTNYSTPSTTTDCFSQQNGTHLSKHATALPKQQPSLPPYFECRTFVFFDK
jgi:hypothetical protein